MSTGVIITLIICGTIIVSCVFDAIKYLIKMKTLNKKVNELLKEEK